MGRITACLAVLTIVALGAAPGVASAADPVRPGVVGGEEASEAYSFAASMQSTTTGQIVHSCGGVLIRPQWVLTAQHCVAGFDQTGEWSGMQFRIGSKSYLSGGTVATFDRWAEHPIPTVDVALVHLTRPVADKPIGIAASAAPGTPLRLLGWGCTDSPVCPPTPATLRQLDTVAVPDADCLGEESMSPAGLCVGNPGGNRGPCYGDSGGPAITGSPGNWSLAGSTVGGLTVICGEAPAIYANLPKIRDWIDGVTGPASARCSCVREQRAL